MRSLLTTVGLALAFTACAPSKPDFSPIAVHTFAPRPSFDAKYTSTPTTYPTAISVVAPTQSPTSPTTPSAPAA